MMLDLFLVLCLSGVAQSRSAMYFVKKRLSWPDAQTYCRTYYSDLARVESNAVLLTINTSSIVYGLSTFSFWIGLYNDIASWRWSFNNISLASTSEVNWYPGQPDNYQGAEACAGINVYGSWADWTCCGETSFICYNASNSGSDRFIGVTNPPMNWTSAQIYCRTFHTDLASSLTQTDNDLLQQIASVQGFSWFGLYRDTWKWLNNTVASNLQWNTGQPDNAQLHEDCAILYNGKFSDENCSLLNYFISELFPVKKQVVKLEVKSNGSVFDPALLSSILNLMKQKIEQHGILKTTVTWRVQPDGNIFYKKRNIN